MSEKKSLARNTLYSAASSASSVFLVLLVILAARMLGDKAFGEFSFALAIATIFEMFTDLGLNTLSARNIPRDRTEAARYLPNILGWKLILSAGAMLALIATVTLMSHTHEARVAALIMGGAVVIRSYKSTSFAFFQAFERFDLILLTTYTERLLGLMAGIAALLISRDLIVFVSVFALVRIPDIAFTYWLVHRHIAPVRFGLDGGVVRSLQTAAVPFALSSIVTVGYMNVGNVILAAMRPSVEVGWYNAGYKIYEGLTAFPFLISAVLLPRLSHFYATDRVRYEALCRRALRYLVMCALPLIAFAGLAAPHVIRLVYGPQYLPGIPALKILLLAAGFMCVNWVLNTALIAGDLERVVLRTYAVGLLVMVAANCALIPLLGMIGAAYAVVISELCVFSLMMATAHRKMFRLHMHEMLARPVAAMGVGLGTLYLVSPVGPVYSAVIFAAVYLLVLLALGALDAEEWSALRGLVARSSNRL